MELHPAPGNKSPFGVHWPSPEMEHLRQADLRAGLDFLEKIGGAGDLDEFAETLLHGLGEAIAADVVAFNEVNPELRRACFVADVDLEGTVPEARAILERHMDDNPLVVYTARTRDGSAHTWSDFVTRRRLHATALWNGLFRPFGIERQMVAVLPAPAPLLVGIVLHRCGRDFSVRDRALLDLLRPHLTNAYRNVQARAALTALAEGEGPSREMLVVGMLGEPLTLTPRARELVAAFGPGGEQLLAWIDRTRRRAPLPAEPLLTTHNGRTVEARFLAPTVVGLRPLREPRLAPETLRPLGLARREREVLALLAEGHTNKEIAARLDVQSVTVKKYLERIYDKLGVHTRTAAAAAAHREAGA